MKKNLLIFFLFFFTSAIFAKNLVFPIRGFETTPPTAVPIECEWNEKWFGAESSFVYNHNLARIAGILSEVAYIDVEDSQSTNEIGDCYKVLGCDEKLIEYHYDVDYSDSLWGNDQTAFSFATKQIDSADGKHNLIFIVIRGTPLSSNEWISNVNISDRTQNQTVYHEGFLRAAQQLNSAFISYLLRNRIDIENCFILITGPSRGAAVANLYASQLLDSDLFDPSRIYAYTFASPNVTTREDANDEKYNYIWNIVNAEDIVPTVPMNYKNWKFKKFGQTRALINAWNCDPQKYENEYIPAMNAYYTKFLERNFIPFRIGPFLPIQISAIATSFNKDVNKFYTGALGLRKRSESILKKIFAGEDSEEEPQKGGFFYSIVDSWLNKRFNLGTEDISKIFIDMHAMESYLSWILALNEDQVFSTLGTSLIVLKGNCDYAVFSADGTCVATILDGTANAEKINLPIAASSFLQDSVYIGLPANNDFSIALSKESLIPTHLSAKIQHYDATGLFKDESASQNFYPQYGNIYTFKGGSNTLSEEKINAQKLKGKQVKQIRLNADLHQRKFFKISPEFYGSTTGELGGGIHFGNRTFYGTALMSHNFIKPFRSLEISPGFGSQVNLYGPILLDIELFSKSFTSVELLSLFLFFKYVLISAIDSIIIIIKPIANPIINPIIIFL